MTVATRFFNWPQSGIDNERAPYEACSPNLLALRSYLQERWGGQYLGCHEDRDNRSGTSISTHAYGAAIDWRYPGRALAVAEILPFLIDHSAELGIMSIHDYVADRIWHAGRTSSTNPADWWKKQNGAGAGMGESWATYLHIESHPDAFSNATSIHDRLHAAPPTDPGDDDMTPDQAKKLDETAAAVAEIRGVLLDDAYAQNRTGYPSFFAMLNQTRSAVFPSGVTDATGKVLANAGTLVKRIAAHLKLPTI